MTDYRVKEIFVTLQGEGFHSGRKAVFVRLAGCNLWSGFEEDRPRATCGFCDTDFRGGSPRTALAMAAQAGALWGPGLDRRWAVLTGGEPALQADEDLVARLHDAGFMVAMETNGTRWLPAGLDWVTVSPKAGARLHVRAGDELKVVWPQSLDLDELAGLPFPHRWLQPNARDPASAAICVRACLADPRWRLSVQVQKVLGIP